MENDHYFAMKKEKFLGQKNNVQLFDSMEQLSKTILSVANIQTTIVSELQQQVSFSEEYFMFRLMNNRVKDFEISQYFSTHKKTEIWIQTCCVIVKIDTLSGKKQYKEAPETRNYLYEQIRNLAVSLFGEDRLLSPIIINDCLLFAVGYNYSADDQNKLATHALKTTLKKLVKKSQSQFDIPVCIGISDFYHSIGQTSRFVYQANNAARYLQIFHTGNILTYGELRSQAQSPLLYPEELEQKICESFSARDGLAYRSHIEKYLQVLLVHNIDVDHYYLFLTRLITTILTQNLGNINFSEIFGTDFKSLLDAILLYGNPKDLVYCLRFNLLDPIIQYEERQHKRQELDIYQRTLSIISMRQAPNITLEYIANTLQVSPEKISSAIHKKTGKTFRQLLSDCRLFVVRQQLTETKISIQEIAASMGYGNTQNFIRWFKSVESVSPNQFRSMFSSSRPDTVNLIHENDASLPDTKKGIHDQ
jgi:two-component system response regulator YesN